MENYRYLKELLLDETLTKNYGSLEETATLKVPVNLVHPGYLGVLRSCDQPIPGTFSTPTPTQRKGPGNEFASRIKFTGTYQIYKPAWKEAHEAGPERTNDEVTGPPISLCINHTDLV